MQQRFTSYQYPEPHVNPENILANTKQLNKQSKLKEFKTSLLIGAVSKPNFDWLCQLITDKLDLATMEKVILHDTTQNDFDKDLHLYSYDNRSMQPTSRRNLSWPCKMPIGLVENQVIDMVNILKKHNNIDIGYFHGLN